MHLRRVPPATGLLWVRAGLRTFFRQPLAMTGLFFMFMLVGMVAGAIPLLGHVLLLALLPAATLGFMAASREVTLGRFPMPVVLASAFRAGQARARSTLVLGAMYALGFSLVMGATALIDGGTFAKLYLFGGELSAEVLQDGGLQSAVWAFLLLCMPLAALFWHAPALVHWHDVTPLKSLFFSAVACWHNLGAMLTYLAAWLGLFLTTATTLSLLAAVLGSPALAGSALFPVALLVVAMFFSSFYFTYRDSFEETEPPAANDPETD